MAIVFTHSLGDISNLVSRLTQQHLDRIQQLEHELATSKAVNDYFQDKIESLKSEKDTLNRELTSSKEGGSIDSKAIEVCAQSEILGLL